MTTNQSTAIGVEWPRAVAELAAEEGVEEYLSKVLEMTQRIFSSARQVDIFVEEDPEIANDRHIVFLVEATLDVSQAVATQNQWCQELFDCCPAPSVSVFRVRLRTS